MSFTEAVDRPIGAFTPIEEMVVRAMTVRDSGRPEVLVVGEAGEPVAGPGEVVVDVDDANITFGETQLRAGSPPYPGMLPALPVILGMVSGAAPSRVRTRRGRRESSAAQPHRRRDGHTLRIFLIKFTRFGPGPWDWRWSGTDIATLSLPDLRIRQITPVEAGNGVAYGAYVLSDRRHTYMYGLEDLGLTKLGHVARTPNGRLLDQDEWEFWTGDGWSSDPSQTAPMLDDSIANEYSVTKVGNGYVMITMDTSVPLDEWRDIVAYTSCSPQGPWTNRTVVYQAPEADDPELWPYNAHAHPQFTRRGQLLVSYNVNSSDFSSLFEDADRYRARFIRVPVPGLEKR